MSSVVSRNPYTGEVVFSAVAAGRDEVNTKVGRAVAAAAGWAAAPTDERAAVLRRFADLVDSDAGELADLIVAEVGKLRSEALGEVEWTARSARYYADHPPAVDRRAGAVVRRRALGVVAAVTPWNVPLVTPAWKWLPAVMAGNAVVWKPSELASATAMAAVERLTRAGLPAGVVVPVLGGAETGQAVCADPRVQGITFTGSTQAGRTIAMLAAQRFVPCALEMSGINVAVVFSDADLDLAVDCVAGASTAINGTEVHSDAPGPRAATRRPRVRRSPGTTLRGATSGRPVAGADHAGPPDLSCRQRTGTGGGDSRAAQRRPCRRPDSRPSGRPGGLPGDAADRPVIR